MANLHIQSLKKAMDAKKGNNPRCALIRIVERYPTSTECIDYLLDQSCPLHIFRKTWMTVARMEMEMTELMPVSSDKSYQGCYLLLRGKTPWLIDGESSIKTEFEAVGVTVHSVVMMERSSWARMQTEFAEEIRLMRNCVQAGDEPPHKLVDPEKGGLLSVVPRGPQMMDMVPEPPARSSPGTRSMPTMQCLERDPSGSLPKTEIIPFACSLIRVRRCTMESLPPAVRSWCHAQLRNKIQVREMQNFYRRIPLGVDGRNKYLPEMLFTRKGSQLSQILDHITDCHQRQVRRSFSQNTQTGLHRLRIMIYVRLCRAPRMQEGFKPLELCDVYDIRTRPGARGTTAEDCQLAMGMTATARLCLAHPELAPTEAEHFVSVNPMDWKQLVKDDACRPQGPGPIARKVKRLFTDRERIDTHQCRPEVRCGGSNGNDSKCLQPYYPALFRVDDDGEELLIDYVEAKAEYDLWFEKGIGGPQIPWLDTRSPLENVIFVPAFVNFAGADHAHQIRTAINERMDGSYETCDLLVPAAMHSSQFQGNARIWSTLCRQSNKQKRTRTELNTTTPIQLSWNELMIDSRRSQQFWDQRRKDVPLVLLFPCREAAASILWLMRQAFVRASASNSCWRQNVVVVYNPMPAVSAVTYRTWDPCFPEFDLSDGSVRTAVVNAVLRTLKVVTLYPTAKDFVTYCDRVEKASWAKGRSTDMSLPTLISWCVPPTNLIEGNERRWHPLVPRLLDPTRFNRYGAPLDARNGDRWAIVLGGLRESVLTGWCVHRVLNVQSETTAVDRLGNRVVGVQSAAVARSPQDSPYPLNKLRSSPYRVRPLTGSHPTEYNGLPVASGSLVLGKISILDGIKALLAATERVRRGGTLHMLKKDAERLQAGVRQDDWQNPL